MLLCDRTESIVYLSFSASSMPPTRSPLFINPLVSQTLRFIPLIPLRLFTLDLMAPNLNSIAYPMVLDLSNQTVLGTVNVAATNLTAAIAIPGGVDGVWQLPLRVNVFMDVTMAVTTSLTGYSGLMTYFSL